MMQCYLYSSFPEPSQAVLVELVRNICGGKSEPVLAYLPAGNIKRHFVREVKGMLRGAAEVRAIKPEIHPLRHIHAILDQADMLLIPGGNTYLMAHRLHQIGIVTELRQRITDGLPLVAISAGSVFCGQDVLTTNDINACGCTRFAGLGLIPYNLNAHYPPMGDACQPERDERLFEYQQFHNQPILALEDGSCLHITDGKLEVMSGQVWKLSRGAKEICTALTWSAEGGIKIAT